MKMNKKMILKANKIFDLFGEYITEYKKENKDCESFIYIRDENTGEICCFAIDTKTMQDNVKTLPMK